MPGIASGGSWCSGRLGGHCAAAAGTVAVHVVHRLDQLVHVAPDPVLRQVVPPPADQLVDVHVHQLEDEREPARGLVVEHLAELDHARVRRQPPQRLDLAQVVHLVERVEVVLHALDRDVLAILDALRLEHLGEGALALLADQAVPGRARGRLGAARRRARAAAGRHAGEGRGAGPMPSTVLPPR